MNCPHTGLDLHPPWPNQSVYREDCTQCFDSIDSPSGLNVCLSCFNGGCAGESNHGLLHYQSNSHPLALNIRRTRRKINRDEPPQKISKLAIAAETEDDRYETETRTICYSCPSEKVDMTAGKLAIVVDGILKAMTFARQEEVKAWEQEFTECEHTLCLHQEPSKQIPSQDLGQCSMCGLKENLWLCLECGNLGCGRAQFGGVGGNSHGLAHATESSHPVAVKLGSITPEGSADVYCYKCDEERIDSELAKHLAHWGINIAEREKTEKSLMEMQVEQNLRWDFSMTTEDGRELTPLFGEGFTGLKNIGNSCYLASILQCLFSLPDLQTRYYHPHDTPPAANHPAEDLETQLRKIADGLLSGRYSYPQTDAQALPDTPELPHQIGLAPAMFKHLIGRGHEEFSTMRQQDAFELLLHLFKLMTISQHPPPLQDPVKSFRFAMEQRLQCLNCKKVRYRTDEQDNISIPVPVRRKAAPNDSEITSTSKGADFEPVTLKECLDIFTSPDAVELTCPSCTSKAGFIKQTKFKTFPQNLAVNARRFELVNWVPTKLDIPVEVSDDVFDMAAYKSNGLQEGEEELPEDANVGAANTSPPSATAGGTSAAFTPNEVTLSQLESMGFPRVRCEKALHATGNQDAESAMTWLFSHMEDPDIDEPLNFGGGGGGTATGSGSGGGDDPGKIAQLGDMGITAPQARKALRECGGDVNRALDWVFSHPEDPGDVGGEPPSAAAQHHHQEEKTESQVAGTAAIPPTFELQSIVCHKGASIHAGHYVAFIKKEIPHPDREAGEEGKKSWVLFNDEKVVKAVDVEEMKKFAYVYFFRRV
jgi:ubiquitin carboxyl-terminal hydrolase 5/13